jgi:hypothetical protein
MGVYECSQAVDACDIAPPCSLTSTNALPQHTAAAARRCSCARFVRLICKCAPQRCSRHISGPKQAHLDGTSLIVSVVIVCRRCAALQRCVHVSHMHTRLLCRLSELARVRLLLPRALAETGAAAAGSASKIVTSGAAATGPSLRSLATFAALPVTMGLGGWFAVDLAIQVGGGWFVV